MPNHAERSGRARAQVPEQDYGPDVAAVLAKLRTHACLLVIATAEVAMVLLAPVVALRCTLPEALEAIDEAAAKVGPRAAVEGPLPPGKLAEFVGACIARAGRYPKIRGSPRGQPVQTHQETAALDFSADRAVWAAGEEAREREYERQHGRRSAF